MARFMGLSPYSNPIDAGINTFEKLSGVFRDNDRAESEKLDHEQRRRMNEQTISHNTKVQQWEDEDRPVKVAQNQAAGLKAKYEVLRPFVASAMLKNQQAIDDHERQAEAWQAGQAQGPQQAAQPTFTPPEYSPEEIDAIMHLNRQAPLLDNDPKEAVRQVQALHGLQGVMQQITPQLMQSAAQMPEGQRKVRVSEQNAPGLVGNFNIAFKKMLNSKEAESFLLDMDAGTVIPIMHGGAEGQPSPLTQTHEGQEYVNAIPLKMMQDYISKGQQFGNLLLPALAQTEGNDELLKRVEKARDARKLAQAKAKALEEVPKDVTSKEGRQAYTVAMAKRGFSVTPAEAKELFDDPEAREAAKMEFQEAKATEREDRADSRTEKREDRADRRLQTREMHADGRAERRAGADKKEKDEQARKDKYITEAKADMVKDPEYADATAEERQARAETLAEARMKGEKPAPAPSGDKPGKVLTSWLKSLPAEGWSLGPLGSGTDMKATIKGAVEESGHSVADLKTAAGNMPVKTSDEREKQAQVLKAINDYGQGKPAKKSGINSRKPAPAETVKNPVSNDKPSFDALPPASQFKGKKATDTKTKIKYKSDGKRWIPIPEA